MKIEQKDNIVYIFLTQDEYQDTEIKNMIDKCKQKYKVSIFVSGSQYTVEEMIQSVVNNHPVILEKSHAV